MQRHHLQINIVLTIFCLCCLFFSGCAGKMLTQSTTQVSVASDGTEGDGPSDYPSISSDGRYVAFQSLATNLVDGDGNSCRDVFVHDRNTGTTSRVSVASNGTEGNNHSFYPAVSSDGRYVAFQSLAANLVDDDENSFCDIFIHDLETGTTSRVSVASDGTEGNNHSAYPSISSDGRYVAFCSEAANLVDNDENYRRDVFVHDRNTGTTSRVSVASDGTEGDGPSDYPSISSDGRYIAFQSHATNLVDGDENSCRDVFVHDRNTGTTSRASVASDGTEMDGHNTSPSVSSDGRYVAFKSWTAISVDNDKIPSGDVFVRDRDTGTTSRVNVASDGTEGDGNNLFPSISSDGRYVAFCSEATNLVDNDENSCGDIFVRDMHSGTTSRVSVASDGTEGNGPSVSPSISSDGRYIAFQSHATNLVDGDENSFYDIFVRVTGVRP